MTRAINFPSFSDQSASNRTSYPPYSPPSSHTIQGQDGLKNDPWPSHRQSRLSHEFSLGSDESPKLSSSNRADMGGNLENGSNISKVEINSSQSHFSLYKWASKGVMFAIPIKRVNSSRIKVKSRADRCSSTNGRFQSELPEAILQDVEYPYPDDAMSATTKSFLMDHEKPKKETRSTTNTEDRLEGCQNFEEVVPVIHNPEDIPCRTKDDAESLSDTRKERKLYSLLETGLCGKTDREISALAREVRNTELKSLCSLLHEPDDQQGTSFLLLISVAPNYIVYKSETISCMQAMMRQLLS